MKIILKQSLFAVIASLSLSLVSPLGVLAETNRNQDARTKVQASKDTLEEKKQEKKDTKETRLDEKKLKACKKREKVITNIMARITERGQKQLDLFTTIAERTEAFYIEKGNTLSTIEELTADVAKKKAAAQETVDTIKTSSTDFKCDSEDPKGAAASFKESLQSEQEALKAYKVSVKNLIVGVKSVQSNDVLPEGSEQ